MQYKVVERWKCPFDFSIDPRTLSPDSPLDLLTAGFLAGSWRSQVYLSLLEYCRDFRTNFNIATSSIRLRATVHPVSHVWFAGPCQWWMMDVDQRFHASQSYEGRVKEYQLDVTHPFSDGRSTRPSYPSLGHSFIFHRSDVSSINTTSAIIQAKNIDQQATGRTQSAEKNN